jgi:hypothetical protein
VLARFVRERNFLDSPAVGVRPDDDLLQDVEVLRVHRLLPQGRSPVETKPTGQVTNRHIEAAAEEPIQDATEDVPLPRHVRGGAGNIARCNRHLGIRPLLHRCSTNTAGCDVSASIVRMYSPRAAANPVISAPL